MMRQLWNVGGSLIIEAEVSFVLGETSASDNSRALKVTLRWEKVCRLWHISV